MLLRIVLLAALTILYKLCLRLFKYVDIIKRTLIKNRQTYSQKMRYFHVVVSWNHFASKIFDVSTYDVNAQFNGYKIKEVSFLFGFIFPYVSLMDIRTYLKFQYDNEFSVHQYNCDIESSKSENILFDRQSIKGWDSSKSSSKIIFTLRFKN
jgi:hypothetical protein